MNRCDSEEMAGRAAGGRLRRGGRPRGRPTSSSSTPARSARPPSRRSSAGMGELARLKAAQPGTARRADRLLRARADNEATLRRRYPAVDLFLRPDEEPELVDRLGLAAPTRRRSAAGAPATTRVGRTRRRRRRPPARHPRAAPWRRGRVARGVGAQRLAADHLRLRQDVHLLHRAVQPRPGAQPPVRRHRRRGARARRRPATARSRCSARTSTRTATTCPPEPRFAARRRARAGPVAGWTSTAGRTSPSCCARSTACATPTAGPRIPRLRFVTSHPWDLSDRLIAAMAECPSVCEHLHLPVQSGDDAVLRRMGRQYTIEHYLERAGADPRGRARASRSRPTSSSGSAARPRRSSRRRSALLETVRYDQVFAAAFSPRPGHAGDAPRRRRPAGREAPPAQRAARAPGGASASSATGRWLGRDGRGPRRRVVPPRAEPRPRGRRRVAAPRRRATSGSPAGTASNKLVHLDGAADARRARASTSRIEHAGPYALRGALASRRDAAAAAARRHRRARPRPARPASRSRSPRRSSPAAVPPRSSPPTRARSTAAWTSARPRSTAADRARVPHHGLDLVDPDAAVHASPTSRATPTRRPARTSRRAAASRSSSAAPASTCAPSRAASTPTRCRATRRSGRALEAELAARRPRRRSSTGSRRSRPASPRRIDLRNPRRVVRALEIAELAGRRAAARAARLRRRRSPGSA